MPQTFQVQARPDGVRLAGETEGAGEPMVLLHGLTATRRYVLMGSRYLARRGWRLVGYDVRGHGESAAAPDPGRYEYADQVADLEAVLHALGLARVVLAGNSMGAHAAAAFALAHPERVVALVAITPGYAGRPQEGSFAGWDRLADALERRGVDGFLEAYAPTVPARVRDTVLRFTRQRLERHRDPAAVAAALRIVPRSAAFDGLEALERIAAPALVVGSRDETDPGHPLWIAEAWAERLGAELLVEDEGASPLAWQGARLSRTIEQFLVRAR